MSHKQDIIPASDQDFSNFEQTLVAAVILNQMAWGISLIDLTPVTTAQGVWTLAWNAAKNKNTRSHEEVVAKDTARATYEPVLRNFLQLHIVKNNLITDAQRAAMGIEPYDTHHTLIPVPTVTPIVVIEVGAGGGMVINFLTQSVIPGKFKRAKPEGVAFIQIAYVVDPAQVPATPNDCNRFDITTRSPKKFGHDPVNAGKKIYFFCRYANPRGEGGPWSTVQSFDMP